MEVGGPSLTWRYAAATRMAQPHNLAQRRQGAHPDAGHV